MMRRPVCMMTIMTAVVVGGLDLNLHLFVVVVVPTFAVVDGLLFGTWVEKRNALEAEAAGENEAAWKFAWFKLDFGEDGYCSWLCNS